MSDELMNFVNECLRSIMKLAALEEDPYRRKEYIRNEIIKLIVGIDMIINDNKNIFYDHQIIAFNSQKKVLKHLYLDD